MSLFQPSGQIKLTNVSVVRLKKQGKRFEIACYKNKVLEFRRGVETDLDNVMQTMQVFTNVSKGQVCSSSELEQSFGTKETSKCILEILKKGELQVSTLERNNQLQTMQKDIINIIAEKTVHPDTKRPYPPSMIEKAVDQLHFSINSGKSAKQQALDVIKLLQQQQIIPIQRAQMKIQIKMPTKDGKRLKDRLMESISTVIEEDFGTAEYQIECLIDPGQFKVLTDLVQAETRGKGHVDVLSLSETVEGDEKIE